MPSKICCTPGRAQPIFQFRLGTPKWWKEAGGAPKKWEEAVADVTWVLERLMGNSRDNAGSNDPPHESGGGPKTSLGGAPAAPESGVESAPSAPAASSVPAGPESGVGNPPAGPESGIESGANIAASRAGSPRGGRSPLKRGLGTLLRESAANPRVPAHRRMRTRSALAVGTNSDSRPTERGAGEASQEE
ncbi:hypothetical protein B0H11DRAFT_1941804 [Mycena galericulata]|nr:hypothetical protein B0H11DRAFT_1941804 [Mycena galericulata]